MKGVALGFSWLLMMSCSEQVSAKAKNDITYHYHALYARLVTESPEDAQN